MSSIEAIYLCDGDGCSRPCGLKSEYCQHTTNIEHARYFKLISDGDRKIYVETIDKTEGEVG